MSDWMPIETAPRDGTAFLAFVPNYGCVVMQRDRNLWAVALIDAEGDPVNYFDPTHWMPLPNPPQPQS